MYSKRFLFGSAIEQVNDNESADVIYIKSKELFSEDKGYGLVDQNNLKGKTMSESSLYSGGWNMREVAKDKWQSAVEVMETCIYSKLLRYPIIFKTLVPEEGTYKITIKIDGGIDGAKDLMIFTNRRNLVKRKLTIKPEESYEYSFMVYICPYIPAMTSVPNDEKAIYISVLGNPAKISEIKLEKSDDTPVLFIAGDSTLTDQNTLFPYYPFESCGGWAQMLLQYFDSMAICNQAHSGLTSNCFRDDGHWDIVRQRIKPGDIFMIQFGHNDQKRRNLAAFRGYMQNLRWYVMQARLLHATPIIVSPISRIPIYENGKYYSLLSDYAMACCNVAEELNVPFIDLHQETFEFFCALREQAHDYFNGDDITHTNDFGAVKIADFVAQNIIKRNIKPLYEIINKNIDAKWNPEDEKEQAPSEQNGESGGFKIDLPYVDIQGIPQYKLLEQAMERGLLDPCVMYLHPYADIPRGQFLFIYFKALRLSGKRPYMGYYCDIGKFEWDSAYVQAALDENLIDLQTTPNNCYRPDDSLTCIELVSFVIRGIKKTVAERDISLEECEREAAKNKLLWEGYESDKPVHRIDYYVALVKMMDLSDTITKDMPTDIEIHPVG